MTPLVTTVVPWRFENGTLQLLDQRLLPHEETWLVCDDAAKTADAIRTLAVRGAPLIGVAAALGLAAEARRHESDIAFEDRLSEAARLLAAARPTAVNLPLAMSRLLAVLEATRGAANGVRIAALEVAALALAEEDRASCEALSRHGAAWLGARIAPGAATLLTHCNAGALATAGIGTALGVVRALALERPVAVFSDETRPFLQGARLTAFELQKDGIPVTLLPDVAAASVLASGRVSAVVVGADRIAANGDVANKVGTYGVALACRAHGIPFLVAAPTTTLDLACATGAAIPIELREGEEVLFIPSAHGPVSIAPRGVPALYPAFDVTPAALVSAIVTERGVAEAPYEETLARFAREGEEAWKRT